MNRPVNVVTVNEAQGGDDLITRIMSGDEQAEAELVERYTRGVMLIIRRELGGACMVDDLYQETFRIALEKIRRGDLREPEKLSGFMCSIARNLLIGYFRRATRQRMSEIGEAAPLPYHAPDQLEELLQQEKAAIVRRVINELPSDRDRQIPFRFYIAEEEKERICADLGLTGLHFNRVLYRARERYRELYEKAVKSR